MGEERLPKAKQSDFDRKRENGNNRENYGVKQLEIQRARETLPYAWADRS